MKTALLNSPFCATTQNRGDRTAEKRISAVSQEAADRRRQLTRPDPVDNIWTFRPPGTTGYNIAQY